MQGVKAKKVLGYMILPGIIPRTKGLFASGFGYLAFLMAQIYGIVKLLPSNHPYLEPQNIGKYGVRHVIGEAANNLVVSRKNIDQIIIFVILILGIVILVMQMLLLLYGYIVEPALAQLPTLFQIDSDQANQDIAFMMMDRVFGIPNFFDSCINRVNGVCRSPFGGETFATEPGNLPHPFHHGLHSLFRFYSLGLLVVASLIFLYFVVIVIGETAVTGTPFGQRFQNVWVPIRLVLALGLLVPINYGLNSGQYIVLYAAKAGSNFATNGWLQFNNALNSGNLAQNTVALPPVPDMAPTVAFMSMAHACTYGYWHQSDKAGNPVVPSQNNDFYEEAQDLVKPYFVKNALTGGAGPVDYFEVLPNTSYEQALEFYGNSNIRIRFGIRDEGRHEKYKGYVEPTCGEINISITDVSVGGAEGPGAVQKNYYELIRNMWFASNEINIIQIAQKFMALEFGDIWRDDNGTTYYVSCTICSNNHPDLECDGLFLNYNNGSPSFPGCALAKLGSTLKSELVTDVTEDLSSKITLIWNNYNQAVTSQNDINDPDNVESANNLTKHGWGGAGIWYNQIHRINGGFISAVANVPSVISYPIIMEEVRKVKASHDSAPASIDQFELNVKDNRLLSLDDENLPPAKVAAIAKALDQHYKYWYLDGANHINAEKVTTGSVLHDIMNFIFGTSGLMAIRGENAYIHPLAQLTAVGKSLVDSAIINILGATLDGAIGNLFDRLLGLSKATAAGLATSIAFISLTAGFILYYILPFLPFLYFFFAVGGWVKGIFEAMVGVPLWALAHLRIDGEGLPGDSATNGYFLIFEIFLRPILTVIALIASVTIFTAQVRVLHSIWPLVLDNLTGYSDQYEATIFDSFDIVIKRGILDQFFFTILYTTIVYMLATASFKLIDQIPDNILRWLGGSVSSFSDINQDPTSELTRYASTGALTFGRQLTTSAQQVGQGVGTALGKQAGQFEKMINNIGSDAKKQ